MTSGITVLGLSVVLVWWMAGSRSLAYLVYAASFVPFVTLEMVEGGLQDADGLGSEVVLFKAGARVATAGLVLLLVAARRPALGFLARWSFLPVVAFVGWALLGLAQLAEPALPLARLGELAVFALLGVLLWSESGRAASLRELLRWHATALLPLVLVTVYISFAQPGLALHVDPSGMVRMGNRLLNAETLGTISALLVLWASFELKEPRERRAAWSRERLLPLACLALALVTLVLARSRMAMIATVAGEAVLWAPWNGATLRRWIASAALVVAALAWLGTNLDLVALWFLRGDSVETLVSGTGRTGLWAHLVRDVVPFHPLLGTGYLDLSGSGGFDHAGSLWSNAHNAYLAALIYTGIPGLVLFLAIATLPVVRALRRVRGEAEDRASWSLVLAWGALTLLANLTSFGLCGWPNPHMLFFFALFPITVAGPRLEHVPEAEEAPLVAAHA